MKSKYLTISTRQKKSYLKELQYIGEGKIIGWFQGRMEFGPRALGGRSIIGDARNSEMQTKMNLSIKFRESFSSFCSVGTRRRFFNFSNWNTPSPYMLLVASVKDNIRKELSVKDARDMKDPNLLKRVKIERSSLPANTHVDYSA